MKLRSPSLFWRTFLLVLLLIVASLVAWLQSFRVFEREPRARQIAQQVVSIVNITRGALIYSDPVFRRELLDDLTENEGIRIVPLEPTDTVKPFPSVPLFAIVADEIRARLGADTQIAAEVNQVPGVWVSFDLAGDHYWVYIARDPLARELGTQWIGWATAAMLLSVLVAVAITRVVNRPLAQLSRAARELGSGKTPPALPEKGPAEIRMVNQSFNRMVTDLGKLAQDRAVLLAGISHDLRTPLTRLRLEVDINDLPPAARAAMIGDIEQMDSIVGQFLDYARAKPQQPREEIDLSALVQDVVAQSRLAEQPDTALRVEIADDVRLSGYRTELTRALDNLLTNAGRYGRDPQNNKLEVTVSLAQRDGAALLAVADHGPGVDSNEIDRLLRPFERGEGARTDGAGAGLGLAIVDRIAQLHGGALALKPNPPHGLRAELQLPLSVA